MRIIGGEKSGLHIKHPGHGVRVSLDSVRESVFNMVGAVCENAVVLDLYSGSGSLGIEAMSRGAARCVFVERSRGVAKVLSENLRALDLTERSVVKARDVERIREWTGPDGEGFDLVFMDPPYGDRAIRSWGRLMERCSLQPDARLVLECGSRDEVETAGGWKEVTVRRFGQTQVRIFQRVAAARGVHAIHVPENRTHA